MSKGKLVAVCLVWLALVGVAAVAWRMIVAPRKAAQADRAQQDAEARKRDQTSSASAYDHQISIGLDSFSGYAVFRSPGFRRMLAQQRIDLELHDDGADYGKRLGKLQGGQLQMAVFPIDALLASISESGKMPATIVAIVDETRGADAMVADRNAIPNPDALNDADVRFIFTPNSPSEMLIRLMQSEFRLDQISADALVPAKDADDVYRQYLKSPPGSKDVYVIWEPYVSKILENDQMGRLIDSAQFKGYIVDCLVVSRDYLLKNPDAIQSFVGCYFRTLYQHQDKMVDLVMADAKQTKTALTRQQAVSLVEGIWWKNTLENFEHFGIAQNQLQLVEDMIENITQVMVKTGAIANDPLQGKPWGLYYRKTLDTLRSSNFHPNSSSEEVRSDDVRLPDLSAQQWSSLQPVGEMQVADLIFARGRAKITDRSKRILDELATRLETWPQYYVRIRGNASTRGNLAANETLALDRAKTAADYLIGKGVARQRVRAEAGEPSGSMSVTFHLGQAPY